MPGQQKQKSIKKLQTTIFHKNTKRNSPAIFGQKKTTKIPALDNIFLFGKNTRQLRKFPPCIERCGPARCEGFPPAALRAAASNPPRPKQNCEPRKANVSTTTAVHNKRYVDSSNLLLVYLVYLIRRFIATKSKCEAFKKKTLHHDPFRLKQHRNHKNKARSCSHGS